MTRILVGLMLVVFAGVAAAQDDLKAADAELNRLYREMEARLADDADTLERLKASQRAWIAFRDAECAFAASAVEGGSAYPEVVASCRAGLTTKRVADFNAYLACEEGDLACPVPAE